MASKICADANACAPADVPLVCYGPPAAFYTQNTCTRGSEVAFLDSPGASDKSSFWDVFSFFISSFFFVRGAGNAL